jgi:hypothetical protein
MKHDEHSVALLQQNISQWQYVSSDNDEMDWDSTDLLQCYHIKWEVIVQWEYEVP